MLSSKTVRRKFVCLGLLLPAITGISAAGQSSSTLCAPTAHAVVLYAPESNLERSEIETLRTAKVSVDVAMYSFTDRELAAELVRLARSEASSKNTEGLNLAHPVGHTDGEEQVADHGGKKDKDNEIIVLKRGAK